MNVNIYKRSEAAGKFSYLAVPQGGIIPEEVTGTDWQTVERNVELNEDKNCLSDFSIDDPVEQITAKGYAITSVESLSTHNGARENFS